MARRLFQTVLDHPHLPMRLKHLLMVLAWTAKHEDGTGIFIGIEKLARKLGTRHRQTATRLIAYAASADLVRVERRGGHRRGDCKVTYRALNVEKILAFGPTERAHFEALSPADRVRFRRSNQETQRFPDLPESSNQETQRLPDRSQSGNPAVASIDSRSKRQTVTEEKPIDLRKLSAPSPKGSVGDDDDEPFGVFLDHPELWEQLSRERPTKAKKGVTR
jgi:hypothetical protein